MNQNDFQTWLLNRRPVQRIIDRYVRFDYPASQRNIKGLRMDDFQQWLERQSIDCNELTLELEDALRQRFDRETEQYGAPDARLVIPSDLCQWPARGYWIPTK